MPAQADSSQLDYIYLRQYKPGDREAIQPWEGDFMRQRVLVRLDAFHPANAPIIGLAEDPLGAWCQGLPGLILSKSLIGQLNLHHPADPTKLLSYVDLADKLARWQGLEAAPGQPLQASSLGLEWLLPTVDLIVDRRFNGQDSRSHYQIRYVRLIWHHPQLALGPRAVAMVSYRELRPFLLEFSCPAGPQSPEGISAAEFLEQGYVVGQLLRLPEDPVIVLPDFANSDNEILIDWEH